MKFVSLELSGLWLIEPEFVCDERGAFARAWCSREFESRGLNPRLAQCNVSINHRRGTVRGMHFQREPHSEAKLVRVTRGAIFDVAVDLRTSSPTCGRWTGIELSAQNHRAFYIPEGFAHGFQTLTDDVEISYQMSHEFVAGSSAGVRWNDPAIRVEWPLPISVIAAKDEAWPDWEPQSC